MMPDVYLLKANGDELEPGAAGDEDASREEEQPLIPETPKSPNPGEGATSFPGEAAGSLRSHGDGDRPAPPKGSAVVGSGQRPVKRPGLPQRFRPGQPSLGLIVRPGEEAAKPEEYGEGPTTSLPETAYTQQHGEPDEQFAGLTVGRMARSLSGGFNVFILEKGDRPVTAKRSVGGVSFRIENPAGSVRQGKDKDGVKWKTTMTDDYGYIPGVPGVDGDSLDVFVGPEARKLRESKGKEGRFDKVWVVHAKNPKTGKFDEDKVMFGYRSKESAVSAFRRHYDKPDDFLGPMNEYSLDEFKKILRDLKRTKRPKRLGRGSHPLPSKR